MNNFKLKKINGYIEGYYGKLLTWNDRKEIIKTLSLNKMNFYFYCPKEDIYHRSKWREAYDNQWLKNFNNFNKFASSKNVNILTGISPGLDFDFKSYINGDCNDFNVLVKKIKLLMKNGSRFIAILLDDIPNNFKLLFPNHKEGLVHAQLINDVMSKIGVQIFTVPRIYTDELIHESHSYLNDFFSILNKNAYTFFCGKYVVSKTFKTNLNVVKRKIKDEKIIYWDNFYANDYCPKRLIIGPWQNKSLVEKSMINGTGLLQTDKLIIEIVNKTANKKKQISIWKSILRKHRIPDAFFKICKPFLSPNYSYEKKIKKLNYNKWFYKNLDLLLWGWKTDLSREWYQYLMILKHDLQILNKDLSLNRIIKTQTNPLQIKLYNRRN